MADADELVRALQRAAFQTPVLVALSNEAWEVHASLEAVRELDDIDALKLGVSTAYAESRRVAALQMALHDAINAWFEPSILAYGKLIGACETRLRELGS